MTTIALFLSLFLLIALSVPIGIAIGLSTLFTALFFTDSIPVMTLTQKVFTSLDSFPIMAIPFFMMAGILMGKGGVSKRLLDFAGSLVGFVAGGLAMVTVLTCMFFSAISGSGPATVAAIGSFMIPAMEREKYGRGFAAAITASAGAIGVIIPPSIPFVLYGVIGGVSIGSLFLAGILPGIMIGLSLMIASYFIIKRKSVKNAENTASQFNVLDETSVTIEQMNVKRISFKHVLQTFYEAKWALLTPVIILGGIYGSIFTPTESAAVAIMYGLIVGKFIHKELSWKDVYDSALETIQVIGATLYMIGLSIAFAYVLNIEQIPQQIADFILGFSTNVYVVLLLIILFLLVVGAFLDTIAALVILTPILLPIVTQIGVDPVHFGVILVTALAIGFITPPVGVNLFVASAIGNISIEKIAVAAIPLFIVMLAILFLLSYVPFFSTYLPSLST
ncbi:TRAP transporter large permease [Pseudobacillus badius]|uniref:TRAP transporter large permease n=1 Tax=Bacillus badius TaxID=1455 RepID=UPI0007B061DA|nr:TRAP transporter large permease [Bacillus badius]KZO00760.1 C4-dicarboxylate ABC transporter permease [Bacillus badius]OCS88172.1 C4-dicarboxylate ABC transporter permease [Bacillus badius]OVE53301.1 C4-dicarboxylate ABC transporter permease [Bacillus badius]TDW05640.1 C4-dicarboxylate transporter DctM subunit [Bacillus badius]